MTDKEIAIYQKSYEGISAMLNQTKVELSRALPKYIAPDKMIRAALTLWRGKPELLSVTPTSFVGAVLECAQLGLIPDSILGHAHIVAFWNWKKKRNEAQLVPGYKGYVHLARATGEVNDFDAQIVFSKDEFEFSKGSKRHLHHSWDHTKRHSERGEKVAVYTFVVMKNGEEHFEVMNWMDILDHREKVLAKKNIYITTNENGEEVAIKKKYDGSEKETSSTWVDYLDWMAKKTVILQASKLLPLSPTFERAVALDEAATFGYDQNLGATVAEILPDIEEAVESQHEVQDMGATEQTGEDLKAKLRQEQEEKKNGGDEKPPEEETEGPEEETEQEETKEEERDSNGMSAEDRKALEAARERAKKKNGNGGKKKGEQKELLPSEE